MKTLLKYLLKIILTLVALVVVYLACAFCLSKITINKNVSPGNDVTIYIKTNGVHTDIVVPVKYKEVDWSRQVKFENTTLKDSTMGWLALGWGDKGFYLGTPTWADLKFTTAFRAAFGLSSTAIHATFYKALRENQACKKMIITEAQYTKLTNYLLNSFDKDSTGNFTCIGKNANYGNTDAFYEANGRYSLFRTCNTWANTALKVSGQKSCLWTAFDTGIFSKYE